MDKEKWIKDIERKMYGFEMSPPENLWEGIERQVLPGLAERKVVGMRHRWAWASAAVFAGVLVMGGGIWLGSHQEGSSVSRPGSHPSVAQVQKRSESPSKGFENHSETNVEREGAPLPQCPHLTQIYHAKYNTNLMAVTDSSQMQVSQPQMAAQEQPSHKSPDKQPVRKDAFPVSPAYTESSFLASRHSVGDRFSVSLTASNFMSSSSQHVGYDELLAGSIWPGNSDGGGKADGDVCEEFGSLEEVIVGNSDRKVYTKKNHRQPVKVGVSVNYRLTDRWAVGTGLTYSYLSSELTSGTDGSHYTTRQKLQYVGIPLNLSYTFYQRKRWSLYGTTGGMVEKCVKGKSTTDFKVDGKETSSQTDDVKEKRLQYSVNAAVGIQAQIADHVGFYLEPGISYHFDNHSEVVNIYKDTPLNFSIGLGFRYTF